MSYLLQQYQEVSLILLKNNFLNTSAQYIGFFYPKGEPICFVATGSR